MNQSNPLEAVPRKVWKWDGLDAALPLANLADVLYDVPMRNLLALVGTFSHLDGLHLGLVRDDQDIVHHVRLRELRSKPELVPDPIDSQSPSHGVPLLHGLRDDLVDFVLGRANAIRHPIDDDLRGEEALAAPFRDVLSLSRVPLGRAKGVLPPARRVPVSDVEGEEQEIGVVCCVVDKGQRRRARLAALRLEQLDNRQRHDFDEAGLGVHVAMFERHHAGKGNLAALEEIEERRHVWVFEHKYCGEGNEGGERSM